MLCLHHSQYHSHILLLYLYLCYYYEKDGTIIDSEEDKGVNLLRRKLTGYVSYVRGENPYTFPFRIYPDTFAPRRTFPNELLTNDEKGKDGKGSVNKSNDFGERIAL